MNENELAARKLADDPKALRKRLEQAKQVLTAELSRGFGKGHFDFAAKTLTGANGVRLCWRLRRQPSQPIGYENQQTRTGDVFAQRV